MKKFYAIDFKENLDKFEKLAIAFHYIKRTEKLDDLTKTFLLNSLDEIKDYIFDLTAREVRYEF